MLRLIQCEFLKEEKTVSGSFSYNFYYACTLFITFVMTAILRSHERNTGGKRIFASDPSDRCPGGKSVF